MERKKAANKIVFMNLKENILNFLETKHNEDGECHFVIDLDRKEDYHLRMTIRSGYGWKSNKYNKAQKSVNEIIADIT